MHWTELHCTSKQVQNGARKSGKIYIWVHQVLLPPELV